MQAYLALPNIFLLVIKWFSRLEHRSPGSIYHLNKALHVKASRDITRLSPRFEGLEFLFGKSRYTSIELSIIRPFSVKVLLSFKCNISAKINTLLTYSTN
jgi:hypothetical protein